LQQEVDLARVLNSAATIVRGNTWLEWRQRRVSNPLDKPVQQCYNELKNAYTSSSVIELTDWGPDFLGVDKDSSIPIYVQIVDQVEGMVKVGMLAAGDRLPSIRAVAEHLRIDYNTVARAYTELDRAGIIKTARGIGTHVTDALSDDALAASRQAKLVETVAKNLRDLMALGFSPEEIRSAFDECLKSIR